MTSLLRSSELKALHAYCIRYGIDFAEIDSTLTYHENFSHLKDFTIIECSLFDAVKAFDSDVKLFCKSNPNLTDREIRLIANRLNISDSRLHSFSSLVKKSVCVKSIRKRLHTVETVLQLERSE